MVPYALCLVSLVGTAAALNASLTLSAPPAAVSVSGSLVSLSIEQDRWTDWSGTDTRNDFFYNTINNLKQITGDPPSIRIGANSEDRTNFSRSLRGTETIFPPYSAVTPYPEASNITVGDFYYSTVRFLPEGTRVTWGLNLGGNNITDAVLEMESIVRTFISPVVAAKNIFLELVEIGNEPDLYKNNGWRPSNYNASALVADWTRFAMNVSQAGKPLFDRGTKFLGGSLAGSSHSLSGFSPQAMFADGLLDSEPGEMISTFSQHRYSGSFCQGNGGLLQELMDKANVRSNLSQYSPDIAVVKAQNLSYIMGETNSYSCHGAPGVSNTAGAAIWALDYILFAPTIGYDRLFFHEGVGFKYNLIQPVTLTRSITDGTPLAEPLPPHVQPEYYAAIIAAEAIGNSGNTEIVEIAVDHPRISGYAFFECDQLARAVFINSQAFLQGDTNRTSIHLDLDFGGQGPTLMTAKRLAIGFADDTSGVTWGGQTYETADGLVSGRLVQEIGPVSQGLDIAETEAVLLSFLVD